MLKFNTYLVDKNTETTGLEAQSNTEQKAKKKPVATGQIKRKFTKKHRIEAESYQHITQGS
ncbi:hypothetical protein C1H71_05135 [Iodobacter fluviatilis]|uniref:Uncharacterized protein n=1 Tax=Iodobacter fluviatilis TaxID=537 RepID=A0A7G3G6R7_9NEIS|nr:hypothetical protein C1H71_05135 [Iodobacter fluviatilis]